MTDNRLCDLDYVKQLLAGHDIYPAKQKGQNFLTDIDVPVEIAGSSYGDGTVGNCLEIGPGIGCLTRELAARYKKVVAVELDKRLVEVLKDTLSDSDNVSVISDDFMKLDLEKLIKDFSFEDGFDVCANLPYSITTPVLVKLLKSVPSSGISSLRKITVMVQKEVADRICSTCKSGNYGALSVASTLRGNPERLFEVSPDSFYPVPKVFSEVISLKIYENGIPDIYKKNGNESYGELLAATEKLVNVSFSQRRKLLINSISALYGKEKVRNSLEILGYGGNTRGEELSCIEFLRLAEFLKFSD